MKSNVEKSNQNSETFAQNRSTGAYRKIKKLIAFRDKAPFGGGSGMPCGACREFLYQLNEENENMEIMVDYKTGETVTLKELMPNWWGKERYLENK